MHSTNTVIDLRNPSNRHVLPRIALIINNAIDLGNRDRLQTNDISKKIQQTQRDLDKLKTLVDKAEYIKKDGYMKNRLINIRDNMSTISQILCDDTVRLSYSIGNTEKAINKMLVDYQLPNESVAGILRDLQALVAGNDFEDIYWDWKSKCLSICTTSINLTSLFDDIFDIGPILITIDKDMIIQRLSNRDNGYTLEPMEPYLDSSEQYFHPHISDSNRLCEGDGKAILTNALRQKRFLDFLTILNNILHTYASEAAYRSLEDWERFQCPGCGDFIDGDDCYHCTECGTDLCSGCIDACAECGDLFCSDHIYACYSCGTYTCCDCYHENNNQDILCSNCWQDELEEQRNEQEKQEE